MRAIKKTALSKVSKMKPRKESCKQLYCSFFQPGPLIPATSAGSGVQKGPYRGSREGAVTSSEATLFRKDVRHPDKLSAYLKQGLLEIQTPSDLSFWVINASFEFSFRTLKTVFLT